MAQRTSKANQVGTLQQEVIDLQAEIARLQKQLDSSPTTDKTTLQRRWPWRGFVVWLSVAIATALLVVGNIFFWAGNTIVNTDRYVAAVGPLIEKPPIQSAMASYTTTQLFKSINVQHYVQLALPPRAEFLAPQFTSQLQSHTESSLKTVLASPKFHNFWYASLTKSHQALISYSKSYQGNGTIAVSDVFSQLVKQLNGTQLSFLSRVSLPAKVGSIKLATVGWLPALHKIATNIGLYQFVATLLLLGFVALALSLTTRRRRLVIRIGIIFALFMLATLIATRIAAGLVAADVAPPYQEAVRVAYDTVLHSFVTQTTAILLLSLVVALAAWVSGPSRSARIAKGRLTALLSGRLHQSLFGGKENALTRWVGKYKRLLEWGYVLLIALVVLLVQISPKLILIYGLVLLVGILLIEFLAGEPAKTNPGRSKS